MVGAGRWFGRDPNLARSAKYYYCSTHGKVSRACSLVRNFRLLCSRMGPQSTGVPEKLLRPVMPELDSVRGVAVLTVLFFHGFGFEFGTKYLSGIPRWFVAMTVPGWAGVNLFFVLSGFLITGILLDTKDNPHYYKRFYLRRALRILPAYYAVLLVLCIVPLTGWFAHRDISWPFIALSTVFLANVAPLFGVPIQYGVLWSLAVEEHFYLIWPAVVKVLSRRSVGLCAAVIFLGSPILRFAIFKLGYTISPGYTWFVADGLALGALLAILAREAWFERTAAKYVSALCIGTGVLLLVGGMPFGLLRGNTLLGAAVRPTALNLFFGGSLVAVLLIGTSRYRFLVRRPVLQFFGKISYGLYLIHMLSFDFIDHLFAKYRPQTTIQGNFSLISLRFLVAAGIAIGISFLSRRYFEEWFLRLGHRGAARPSVDFSRPLSN